MPELGWESWFGYEEENAGVAPTNANWGTVATSLRSTRVHARSIEIGRVAASVEQDRMQGFRSPIANIQGVETAEGSISLYLLPYICRRLLKNWIGRETAGSAPALETLLAATVITATMSVTSQPAQTHTLDGTSNEQLKLTISTAAVGTIKITGKDRQNNAISETVTTDATNTVYYTKTFFRSIDASGITTTGLADTVRTLVVAASIFRRLYTYDPNNTNNWPTSLTIEGVKGNIPSTYKGMLINSGSLRFAQIPEMTLNFLGKDVTVNQNIAAGSTPTTYNGLPSSAGSGRAAGSIYPGRMLSDVFVGWSNTVSIGGTTYNTVDAEFNLDNGGAYPDTVYGSRLHRLPILSGERVPTITINLPNEEVDLKTVSFTAGTHEVIITTSVNGPGLAYQVLRITASRAQYIGAIDAPVTAKGQIMQTVNYKCLPSIGGADDEFKVELLTREDVDL